MSNQKPKPAKTETWELTPLNGLPKRRSVQSPVSSRLYLCRTCGQDFEGRRASTGAPLTPTCPLCAGELTWTDWPVITTPATD